MTHAQDKAGIISSQPKISPQKTDSNCRPSKDPVILSIPCSMNPASWFSVYARVHTATAQTTKLQEISF